jgi:phage baseplate assembly protein W
MKGMNAITGQHVAGEAHLRQSIIDILTTPLGTRVMRRDYGSRLFELVDAPINRSTVVEIYAATAEALLKWEPRLELTRVSVTQADAGKVALLLQGTYLPDGQHIELEGIVP